jgi:hypothetical protein
MPPKGVGSTDPLSGTPKESHGRSRWQVSVTQNAQVLEPRVVHRTKIEMLDSTRADFKISVCRPIIGLNVDKRDEGQFDMPIISHCTRVPVSFITLTTNLRKINF